MRMSFGLAPLGRDSPKSELADDIVQSGGS